MTPEAAMGVRLLEHPLIQKYFGERNYCCSLDTYHVHHVAYRVLAAMCVEVKQGDAVLQVSGCNEADISVIESKMPSGTTGFHSYCLRLPDAFQPKKECCEYKKYLTMSRDGSIAQLCPRHFRLIQEGFKECSSVEAKIKDITANWQSDATPPGLVIELEKLVELVRQEKA